MNELGFYQFIGHALPRVKYASGVANRFLKPIYNRKPRKDVVSNVLGLKMSLSPRECVDGNLLFCPQIYDYDEIKFLKNNLQEGDFFIDVGANIGFYSLMASLKTKNIIAIEASPFTYKKLQKNLELNKLNFEVLNFGVSDKDETLKLSLSDGHNSGGQTFLNTHEEGISVQCHSLKYILESFGLERIKIMKLDIEGFEYKVLKHFLENVNPSLYPKYIITEFFESRINQTTGNQLELLLNKGYKEIMNSGYNRVLEYS